MSLNSGQSARQLEHEADDTRRRLSATLDNLADNLTPGRMLDEVIAYSRGGGASFLKGLGNAASTNPLPTLLIGVGAAMFLSGRGRLDSFPSSIGDLFNRSNGHGTRRRGDVNVSNPGSPQSNGSVVGSAGEAISDAARSAASGVKDAASSVSSTAANAAERIGAGASDAVSAVKDTAIGVGETVGDLATTAVNAAGEEAAHLRDQALHMTHDLRDRAVKLAEEQPLIVAVTGIALGALIAAVLPRTKVEDDLMGETSDTVKNAAGEVASEQIAKVSSEADKVAGEIKETMTDHGITPKAAVNVVREAGDRVVTALGSGEKGPASGANS